MVINPGMEDKKMFATRVDPDLLKKLKHLSVDTEKTISELTEEALEDLLIKYLDSPKNKNNEPE